MNKADLLTLSLKELQALVPLKKKLTDLIQKKTQLEKELATIENQLQALQPSLFKLKKAGKASPKSLSGAKKARPGGRRVSAKKKKSSRKKVVQPSLESLVAQVLKENKKPMNINEITNTVLKDKGYKTQSHNFKNQLRVLLYRNQKGIFKKADAGLFTVS